MKSAGWIVCESTSRWSSALRVALARQASPQLAIRFQELRRIESLNAALGRHPESVVAVEVGTKNFAAVLAWLVLANDKFPHARPVALLDDDCQTVTEEWSDVARQRANERVQHVRAALYEAGAAAVVTSPRHMQPVLALGCRHAEMIAAMQPTPTSLQMYAAQVWDRLPWQAD